MAGGSPGAEGCWSAWDAGGWRARSGTSGHRVGDMERFYAQRQKENKLAGRQAGSQADKKSPNQTGVIFPPEG